MTTLKVSGNTHIQKLAGAIAVNLRQNGEVDISLVGASSLNQAIKACITARRFLKDDPTPSDLSIQPEFAIANYVGPTPDGLKTVTTIILHLTKIPFDKSRAIKDYSEEQQQNIDNTTK